MSIQAIILSLPKDVERRAHCTDELSDLGIAHVFHDAIAGDQLSQGDRRNVYDEAANNRKFKRPLTCNEIACALGHRAIWKDIAAADEHAWIVLEDDATFAHDPRKLLDAMSRHSEVFQDVMVKLNGVSRNSGQVINTVAGQDLILSNHLPPRTTGYIIGRRAAERMLSANTQIARPIDIDLKFFWEHKVPILTLGESMVSERQKTASNIESSRRASKSGSSLHRFLRNLKYQVQYTGGRLSHPLKPDRIEELAPLLSEQFSDRGSV